jgi:hypothetical protein
MSPANAPKLRSPSPATDADKKATSPANAQIKSLVVVVVAGVPAVVVEADTLAVAEAVKNATNVVKSVTLLATATKVVVEATKVVAAEVATVVAMAADMVAVEVVVEAVAEVRPATLVVGLVTCPGTAPKARSATTVSELCADSLQDTDRWFRWRSWSSLPRLPVRAVQRARLLQVQAARPRPGFLPQLTSHHDDWHETRYPLSWNDQHWVIHTHGIARGKGHALFSPLRADERAKEWLNGRK